MLGYLARAECPIARSPAWLLAAVCLLVARNGYPEQVEFQLVSASSSLTADGVLNLFSIPLLAQDPNETSLTTTYSGTVTVDVDNVASPTSITFVSANAVAANSGNWLPEVGGGSEGDPDLDGDADPGTPAPANYGFFLDIEDLALHGVLYAASRDTILSLNSSAKAITAGQFDPFGIAVPVVQGVYESNVNSTSFGDDADTDDVTDEMGTNCTDALGNDNRCGMSMGSYAVNGNIATLTLPLDFILGEGDSVQATFTGTFIATTTLGPSLTGDYNADGKVDAADYVVWRDQNINGPQGYLDWRANFGKPSGGATLGNGGSVPEPTSAALVLFGAVSLWICHRSGR